MHAIEPEDQRRRLPAFEDDPIQIHHHPWVGHRIEETGLMVMERLYPHKRGTHRGDEERLEDRKITEGFEEVAEEIGDVSGAGVPSESQLGEHVGERGRGQPKELTALLPPRRTCAPHEDDASDHPHARQERLCTHFEVGQPMTGAVRHRHQRGCQQEQRTEAEQHERLQPGRNPASRCGLRNEL